MCPRFFWTLSKSPDFVFSGTVHNRPQLSATVRNCLQTVQKRLETVHNCLHQPTPILEKISLKHYQKVRPFLNTRPSENGRDVAGSCGVLLNMHKTPLRVAGSCPGCRQRTLILRRHCQNRTISGLFDREDFYWRRAVAAPSPRKYPDFLIGKADFVTRPPEIWTF